MSGGIVKLVATGEQDAWLTGKPEVSFYRSMYRKYTHYANSVERQIIQGSPSAGGMSTIRFEKKGDLLSYVYFTVTDNNGSVIPNIDWTQIFDKFELLIGGQVIDTQDIEYMTDIEPVTGAQNYSQRLLNLNSTTVNNQKATFLPLKFFFCKDWSVSIPLVALQFHDVEIRITWSPYLSSTINVNAGTLAQTAQLNSNVVPAAEANVSLVSFMALSSNVANVTIQQTTGPLFPGHILANVSISNVYTNLAVVQTFSNALTYNAGFSSNVLISYANTAATNVSSGASFNGPLAVITPIASTQILTVPTIAAAATSATFTTGIVSSISGATIAVGQYVIGFPMTGPVTVTAWVPSTKSLTVAFPATAVAQVVPVNTVVSFIGDLGTTTSTTTYASLQFQSWANFIYLDQGERDWFAKEKHDLLVTQVQRAVVGTNPTQELALAQPVKFIAFPAVNYSQLYANGSGSAASLNYQFKTQINGVDVGESRGLPHWVDLPHYYNTPYGYMHANTTANVAVISYCLDTSKLQPTGTLNFSRLDTFRIVTPPLLNNGVLGLCPTIKYPTTYLYAVNYNVLRIMQGTGGLLYAS
jgi:hypothetical protein